MRSFTAAQLLRVHPLRGDRLTYPDAAAEGLARVRGEWARMGKYWARGVKHATAPHAARMRAIVDELEGAPRGASDPVTEATLMVMLDYWSRRSIVGPASHGNDRYRPIDDWFVGRWLAAGGLPFALRVVAAFPHLDTDQSRCGEAAKHTLGVMDRAGDPKWWSIEMGNLGPFHAIRRAVVASNATDYAAARREAERLRDGAPIWLRTAIAFAFPDEAFHTADLAELPAGKHGRPTPSWGFATARIDDVRVLREIVAGMAKDTDSWITESHHYGYSLVHRLGDAAAPLLAEYLGVQRGKVARVEMAQALALTDAPEARAFFDGKQPNKELQAIANAYLGAETTPPPKAAKPKRKAAPPKPEAEKPPPTKRRH